MSGLLAGRIIGSPVPIMLATLLKKLKGVFGAGTFISDTLPEDSAAALREAIARAA